MAIIAEHPLAEADLARLRAVASDVSQPHSARLSIFWTDRTFQSGRFPPLDRIDFLDHAVPVIEREAVRPVRPTLAEVRAYLGGTPFTRWAERAHAFARAETLDPADRKPYLRALLYPARFAYSWLRGDIASNDEAVAFLHDTAGQGLYLAIIDEALRCRRDGRDPDCSPRGESLSPRSPPAPGS